MIKVNCQETSPNLSQRLNVTLADIDFIGNAYARFDFYKFTYYTLRFLVSLQLTLVNIVLIGIIVIGCPFYQWHHMFHYWLINHLYQSKSVDILLQTVMVGLIILTT